MSKITNSTPGSLYTTTLLIWDEFDPVAGAIKEVVEAQNRLTALDRALADGEDITEADYDAARAQRDIAIHALSRMAAWERRTLKEMNRGNSSTGVTTTGT